MLSGKCALSSTRAIASIRIALEKLLNFSGEVSRGVQFAKFGFRHLVTANDRIEGRIRGHEPYVVVLQADERHLRIKHAALRCELSQKFVQFVLVFTKRNILDAARKQTERQ
jgi:hypothetical protein